MAVHEFFRGDFVFNSNDSLDTQISASIDRGDFHYSVISLSVLIIWSIYLLFYNSRAFGLLVSLILRRFVKQGFVRFGSISVSIIGGNILLRDVAYMTNDYTVRCCYAVVLFNYWSSFIPDTQGNEQPSGSRCLNVQLYGLDVHVYNRTSLYDELQRLFKRNAGGSCRSSLHRKSSMASRMGAYLSRVRSAKRLKAEESSDSDERDMIENEDKSLSGSFLNMFWSHASQLLPAVRFQMELTKLCVGNHLLPRACMLLCERLTGTYTQAKPDYQLDKYRHKIVADFVRLSCSFIPVTEYAGQHAIEEPPTSVDRTFNLFRLDRGKLEYIQDEPGIIPFTADEVCLSDGNQTAVTTSPSWGLSVQVSGPCNIRYGPWADRQREILWRFFFPPSYEPAKMNSLPQAGQLRVARKFVFTLTAIDRIELDIFFADQNKIQSVRLFAQTDSNMKLVIPWVTSQDGFRSTLRCSLVKGGLRAQHLWPHVLHTNQLDLDLQMHYPREWNQPHTWDVEVKTRGPQLVFMFDYKHFFKGLIEDWLRGSQADLLSFVPCTYKFRLNAEDLTFILPANDYNWISSSSENAYVAIRCKHALFSFELPFVDYLPDVVSIIYELEASSLKLRLSLPVTSTMSHVLLEHHTRLRLVDPTGRPMKEGLFGIKEEKVPYLEPDDPQSTRQWMECGQANRLIVRIAFTYHPSPHVSDHWRFLPVSMRPRSVTEQTDHRSYSVTPAVSRTSNRYLRHARKQRAMSSGHAPDSNSSSQSELEERVLRGLRPEGSQLQGPTESYLLKHNFDADYLAPDTVDVHLHIPDAQLCFYGSILRHFIHLKENYFGYNQTPVDFARSPITGEEYLSASGLNPVEQTENTTTSSSKRLKESRIIDPRQYRPLMVRLSLEFHNIQVHLPMHGALANAPCPTALLDCIGFEMDKRCHETKIQLIFSPILLCVYDQCRPCRPKHAGALTTGSLQLMGLCLRGQGMFSHSNLPLDAETLEYAWLLELNVGQLTGQLTAPQLTSIVHVLNGFLFTTLDAENELINSRAFVLCQHARPQALCPNRPTFTTDMLCLGETELKYRLIRVTMDGLDLGIVEAGTCLSLQIAPARLTKCNMHGNTRCDGLFVLLPRIRLIQYIRSITEQHRVRSDPSLSIHSKFDAATKKVPWLEAGSLSLGPVHINVAETAERSELPFWQLTFLLTHDTKTKRLWFLWPDNCRPDSNAMPTSPMPPKRASFVVPMQAPSCGCYGHCSFFGANLSGRLLYDELNTGHFSRRTVFPRKSIYRVQTCSVRPKNESMDEQTDTTSQKTTPNAYSTARDNAPEAAMPASHFGESLLFSGRLMHEVHTPEVCLERSNGLLLMRDEVISTLVTQRNIEDMEHSDDCYITSDFSDCGDDSGLSEFSSPEKQLIPGEAYSTHPRGSHIKSRQHFGLRNPNASLKSSRPSSMSEPLVPPDSADEDESIPRTAVTGTSDHHWTRPVTGCDNSGPLPSDLFLSNYMGSPSPSSRSSSLSIASSLRTRRPAGPLPAGQTEEEEEAIGKNNHLIGGTMKPSPRGGQAPPTPPPRQFAKVTHQRDSIGASRDGKIRMDSTPDQSIEDAFNKFVDLRGQLNRPITESGLLRSAYSYHLTVHQCVTGWGRPLRVRHRWHLCKHLQAHETDSFVDSFTAAAVAGAATPPIRSKPPPPPPLTRDDLGDLQSVESYRIGPALAPLFRPVQPGFSTALIVGKSAKRDTPRNKPVVSPERYHGELTGLNSHANAFVWLQNSVDLVLSPLFAESLERYVSILAPILATTPPSAVLDSIHNKCVQLRASQTRQTTCPPSTTTTASFASRRNVTANMSDSTEGPLPTTNPEKPVAVSGIHMSPVGSGQNEASEGYSATAVNSRVGQKMSAPVVFYTAVASTEAAGGTKNLTAQQRKQSNTQQETELSSTMTITRETKEATTPGHSNAATLQRRLSVPNRLRISASSALPTSNVVSGRLAAFSVERINLCFLQLYAVEDLVHLDTIQSGLHDLTCVSLLTFCVDSVSFELMTCFRTDANPLSLQDDPVTPRPESSKLRRSRTESGKSSQSSDQEQKPLLDQKSDPLSHTAPAPSNQRASQSDQIPPNSSSIPVRVELVSCPTLSTSDADPRTSKDASSTDFIPPQSEVWRQHLRQPSAPPVLSKWSSNAPGSMTSMGDPSQYLKQNSIDTVVPDSVSPCPPLILPTASDENETKGPLSGSVNPDETDGFAAAYDSSTTTQRQIPYRIKGSELVCQLQIDCIHGQLRRLTRQSHFNSEVLLTAIPFDSSRTFFRYKYDPEFQRTNNTPPSTSAVWNEHSVGWIMFECGLEQMSLAWNHRDNFDDGAVSLSSSPPKSGPPAPTNPGRPDFASNEETSEPSRLFDQAKQRVVKPPLLRKKKVSISVSPSVQSDRSKPTLPEDATDSEHRPQAAENPTAAPSRNGVLSRLHVNTVWLNFPTPKRLPNKRRVELVRSDWNLLSTTAPSIKAWMDPCDRLACVCRSLQAGMERRVLAVTTFLMIRSINHTTPGSDDSFVLHYLGDKNQTSYATHRTPTANALRFDPSCQLFVVLRCFLYSLTRQSSVSEIDQFLDYWLKDSITPPNDMLQCGIISLTREWRRLVESLSIIAQDMQVQQKNLQQQQEHLFSPFIQHFNNPDSVPPRTGLEVGADLRMRSELDVAPLGVGHALTPIAELAAPQHTDSFTMSHLLRMSSGPVSPITARGMVSRPENLEQNLDQEYPPGEQQRSASPWGPVHPPETLSDAKNNPSQSGVSVMLDRFLHDATVPASESIPPTNVSTTPRGRMEGGSRRAALHHSTAVTFDRRASDPTVLLPSTDRAVDGIGVEFQPTTDPVREESNMAAAHDQRARPRSGRTTSSVRVLSAADRVPTPGKGRPMATDVPMTTEDFEQAAHLNTQYQHVAFIQRHFSLLLESVGLSAKGIRRTTLMKKFGGFFSADGMLELFQIEIVSSMRNPLTLRSTSGAGSSGHTTRGARVSTISRRQSAFLCRKFASKLTFRDVLNQSVGNRDRRSMSFIFNRPNLLETTTQIDVMLNVDFLNQYINLPLLRLVHQFVTMVYCARDTQKAIGTRRPLLSAVTPVSEFPIPRKQDSKGSSDGTDGTLRSRSSGYMRLGESSVDSSGLGENIAMQSGQTATVTHLDRPTTDQCGLDLTSCSSAEKDSQRIDMPVLSSAGMPTHLPGTITAYPTTQVGGPPDYWRHLIKSVQLYTTIPKTKMVSHKTHTSTTTMPTITEEDHREQLSPIGSQPNVPLTRVRVMPEPMKPPSSGLSTPPGVPMTRTKMTGRRLLTSADYQPLHESVHVTTPGNRSPPMSGRMTMTGQSMSRISDEPSVKSTTGLVLPGGGHNAAPISAATSESISPRARSDVRIPSAIIEQWTAQCVYSERTPLAIFVTTHVHKMAVRAVLRDLNLSASIQDVLGSFTHSTQIRSRGYLTNRLAEQSASVHCGTGQVLLTEHDAQRTLEVVRINSGRSHAFFSSQRSLQYERNSCLLNMGRITIKLPHNPVQLQRQAKRISQTVSKLLGHQQAASRSVLPHWNVPDHNASSPRLVTTSTTASTATSMASETTNLGHLQLPRPTSLTTTSYPGGGGGGGSNPLSPKTAGIGANLVTNPPLVFSLFVVAKGFTVNVALHPSLTAVYQINPVYLIGKVGPRGYLEVKLTDHSLSLHSLRPSSAFSRSIRIDLPRIRTTINRRESTGGRYARGQRKEPMLTRGLSAQQGFYLSIQVNVDTLEQRLTTDMLNYIVIAVRLFMKEIKEVIQKMAGDNKPSSSHGSRSRVWLTANSSTPDNAWSRAARGRMKFTIRIRMDGIQLFAITRNGAVKLETQIIDVELTNRVSQTTLDSSLLQDTRASAPMDRATAGCGPLAATRPSNLALSVPAQTDHNKASGDSLFIYATIAKVAVEMGHFDQDLFFNERSPEFRPVAFFRTSVALRSLLADEEITTGPATGEMDESTAAATRPVGGEHDAFLISLNRPVVWMKPFTFDRAILIWMVYKSEFAKWKEHMEYLSSSHTPSMEQEKRTGPATVVLAEVPETGIPMASKSGQESPAPSTPFSPTSATNGTSTRTNPDTSETTTTTTTTPKSTLFLQLNVEDLGICLPINVLQAFPQSIEADSRTALVLTLDRSRITACYRESLVSQGEFTDFCLRFDDEFNVGSDEWKPDWKRASVEVRGQQQVLILNALVVPSGTYRVCWRDPEKRSQCHLMTCWQTKGLEVHFDDNIGRRMKALISVLTCIAGYKGADPLIPTSAEEEDDELVGRRDLTMEPGSGLQIDVDNTATSGGGGGGLMLESTATIGPATSQQTNTFEETKSLDRHRTDSAQPDSSGVNAQIPSENQVRNWESQKHRQEKLDAKSCLAYKQKKWDTLRRKKGMPGMSRSPQFLHDQVMPTGHAIPMVDDDMSESRTRWSRSYSLVGSRRHFDETRSYQPDSASSVTPVRGGTFDFQRHSVISRDDSVYFDLESGSAALRTTSSDSLPYPNYRLPRSPAYHYVVNERGSSRAALGDVPDQWFDPINASGSGSLTTVQDSGGILLSHSDNFSLQRHREDERLQQQIDEPDFMIDQFFAEVEEPSSSSSSTNDDDDEGDVTIIANEHETRHTPPTAPPPPRRVGVQPLGATNTATSPSMNADPLIAQPKLLLKVDVQIHVDSGCFVLHPRLTPPQGATTTANASAGGGLPGRPTTRGNVDHISFTLPHSPSTRLQPDVGGRFSNHDNLAAYLERYKRYLMQDSPTITTELSVFFLPAVDVSLHYNSMTEMEFNAVPSETVGAHSAPNPMHQQPKASGSSFKNTSSPDVPVGQGAVGDNVPLKQPMDLYVSIFLQKLPTETIVHPALLDFLEQALENIPMATDRLEETASMSSGDSKNRQAGANPVVPASSSGSEDSRLWETLSLHAVVHLHVQPFTVRLLCLPVSRMQCLLSMPSVDLVFSTKRNQDDQPESNNDNASTSTTTADLKPHVDRNMSSSQQGTVLPPSRTSTQTAVQLEGSGTTLRLTPNSTAGDVVNQGGICVTAILKEFSIAIFHPYVDSQDQRFKSIPGTGDSLTLLVQDIRFNISRTFRARLVQLVPSTSRGVPHGSHLDDHSPAASPSHQSATTRDSTTLASNRSRLTLLGSTTLPATLTDAWGLHRDLQFSGVIDIGAAIFACDTRRTLEILVIPNTWYRSSLARLLFLGNEEQTADPFSQSTEFSGPEDSVECPTNPDIGDSAGDKQTHQHRSSLPTDTVSPKRRHYSLTTKGPTDQLTAPHSTAKRRSTHQWPVGQHTRPESSPGHSKLDDTLTPQIPFPELDDPQSQLLSRPTTMLTTADRASGASPGGSLRITSWHALPMCCVHLKRLDLNLFMGSAMGQTRLTLDSLFCDGRMSLHSSGGKSTTLSTGFDTCQFTSEGGGVGGEICLTDAAARVHSNEDPAQDPEHRLDARIGGVQLRIEYMATNILLMRVNAIQLRLHDEWKLQQMAQHLVELYQTTNTTTMPTTTSRVGRGYTDMDQPSGSSVPMSSRLSTDGRATFPIATGRSDSVGTEADVGAPPVYVRVVGELKWDQAQTALVRTTTPDLLRSIQKVREYFLEQLREGRMSLIGQGGSFSMFASPTPPYRQQQQQGLSSHLPPYTRPSETVVGEPATDEAGRNSTTLVDQLLQRHWQRMLYESVCLCLREQFAGIDGPSELELRDSVNHLLGLTGERSSSAIAGYPVLGGSMQLAGRSLGIACFAGTFRSAPDWAVFNIQHPTACFETEANHEPLKPGADCTDESETEGWVNVRQVLSFELGSPPEYQAQMAYVLRVRRGNQPITRNLPVLTIAEWLEFTFRGADSTVINFVRSNDPSRVNTVVQLAQFPIQFPAFILASIGHTLHNVKQVSSPTQTDPALGLRPTSIISGMTGTDPVTDPHRNGAQKAPAMSKSRPNPLKPPSEAELLFVLPSISLHITSDQRQTMAQPTLSSLCVLTTDPTSTVGEMESREPAANLPPTTAMASNPSSLMAMGASNSVFGLRTARSWIYGYKSPSDNNDSTATERTAADPGRATTSTTTTTSFSPNVRISFQTDFHGFIHLGLIDVPWLPNLISSYLTERLRDYEIEHCPFHSPPQLTVSNASFLANASTAGAFPDYDKSEIHNELSDRLHQLTTTSSPLVQDARSYEIIHWSLSPVCRWLIASSICVPAFDRLLESIGFRKARVTIPKWLQRGVMDHLDQITAMLIQASMQLISNRAIARTPATHAARETGPRTGGSRHTRPLDPSNPLDQRATFDLAQESDADATL